jgi:hypothetical protein
MTSAEKPLGMASHPFTAASPLAQIFFSAFSLTAFSFAYVKFSLAFLLFTGGR